MPPTHPRLRAIASKHQRLVHLGVIGVSVVCGAILGLVFEALLSTPAPGIAPSRKQNGIGIPALIQQVRAELIESDIQRTAKNMPALFSAKSVDLEISFVVKQSDDLGSKVSLEVVDVDAKHNVSSEQTQKLTIHLDVQQPEQLTIPPTSTMGATK